MSTRKLSRNARIDLAFDRLNELIESGYEYPDAVWAATREYDVTADSKTIDDMYMAKFG